MSVSIRHGIRSRSSAVGEFVGGGSVFWLVGVRVVVRIVVGDAVEGPKEVGS